MGPPKKPKESETKKHPTTAYNHSKIKRNKLDVNILFLNKLQQNSINYKTKNHSRVMVLE